MNKYLCFSLSILVICGNLYAEPTINIIDDDIVIIGSGNVNFDDINIDNMNITINNPIIVNNFSDWQNWNPLNVLYNSVAQLHIMNVDNILNGEKINHISVSDHVQITASTTDRLYAVQLEHVGNEIHMNIVRETNYENVFDDLRGSFLEGIRQKNPNNKMLFAMDRASNMSEINSIMNSSYHFNPIVLMNPIKTINRAAMNDMSMNKDNTGVGAGVNYITSDKIGSIGTRIYMNNKYKDLYFNVGVNLNRFSYKDNLNEFDGFAYGLDVHAKYYFERFWFDGLLGINRAIFDVDDIYKDEVISSNPKGLSEYARFSVGYDYTKISDILISPFIGTMFQKSDVMGYGDTDINLHTGLMGEYNFVTDGIKYEYGAIIATDEKANWDIGMNIGFESVIDKAGAFIQVDAFKDEFGTNYKFAINAKTEF